MGVRGKPRGNPGVVGKGASVVSPPGDESAVKPALGGGRPGDFWWRDFRDGSVPRRPGAAPSRRVGSNALTVSRGGYPPS